MDEEQNNNQEIEGESLEELTENDEISAGEEAFLEGFEKAENEDEKESEDIIEEEKPVNIDED